MDHLFFVSCVSHALGLFIAALKRADFLALVGDVYCIFVTFTCSILGQVWLVGCIDY